MMSLKKWSKKNMSKIYMKDIRNICSCISGLSCQTIRNNKKVLNNWIKLYNNDRLKNKREKKRMNYYINKLNEFERLLND